MPKKSKKKATKRSHKRLPPISFLLEMLDYNPITGELTDKVSGECATRTEKSGYKTIRLLKQTFKAHRICFKIFHRRDPGPKVIDHCDGDKGNNAICNLRAVTQRENIKNTAATRKKNGCPPKAERGAHRCFA